MAMKERERNPRHLAAMQLRLECVEWTQQDKVHRVAGPDPDSMGLVYVLLTEAAETPVVLINEVVSSPVEQALRQMDPWDAFKFPEKVKKIFPEGIQTQSFVAGYFASKFRSIENENLRVHREGKTRVEIIIDGKMVCACESVRENAEAAEAWVLTEAAYRRRGLAFLAVRNWVATVQEKGKTPFYSYHSENGISESLAKRVGVTKFVQGVIVGEVA